MTDPQAIQPNKKVNHQVDVRLADTLNEESTPTKVDAPADLAAAKLPLAPRVKVRKEETVEFKADVSGRLSFDIPEKGSGGFTRRLGKFYEKLDENQEYPMNFIGQGIALKNVCKSPHINVPELTLGSAVFARTGKTIYLISAHDTNGREISLKGLVTQNDLVAEEKERQRRNLRRDADRQVIKVKKNILGIFSTSEITELDSSSKMSKSAQSKVAALEDILVRVVAEKVLQEKIAGKEGWGQKYSQLVLHARKHDTISPYLDTLIMALDPSIHSYHSLRDMPSFIHALEAMRKGPGLLANISSEGRDKNKLAPVVDVLLTKLLGK
jgi:hypothetical protein